jgi:hypothetical protein
MSTPSIEQHDVRRPGRVAVQCRLAAGGLVDGIAPALELLADAPSLEGLVVDDQDAGLGHG